MWDVVQDGVEAGEDDVFLLIVASTTSSESLAWDLQELLDGVFFLDIRGIGSKNVEEWTTYILE
jgi:hypothetical protein